MSIMYCQLCSKCVDTDYNAEDVIGKFAKITGFVLSNDTRPQEFFYNLISGVK